MSNSVFIIAEIGVNHNGSLELAKKLIDVAQTAGADAVKFQTFITEEEMVSDVPKAEYQKQNTGTDDSQFDMVKNLELSVEEHHDLKSYCDQRNIVFMSSPFDLISIELLANMRISPIKIPSGEITNIPYLEALGRLNTPLIMSTGMATIEDIRFAIETLESVGLSSEQISLLHCTSAYPAPPESINLLALKTLKDTFGLRIGYSDHTLGDEVAIAAVALGATIIEKHITLDINMPGPDHAASMEPDAFKTMIERIRNIEASIGDGRKQPHAIEIPTKDLVRKKIVARSKIGKGEQLTADNLTTKRVTGGLCATQWHKVIGTTAIKDYEADDRIEP